MVRKRKAVRWLSKYYGISKPQYELPFVDYNLYSDVPLYIDPFAITKDESELGVICHNAIFNYFQTLLDAIKSEDSLSITRLIRNRLNEPKEIYLGVGKKARNGKGIGPEQEKQIVDALKNSTAAKEGYIQTIQELELHIEGIGPDKISDLVANIILSHLASYTSIKCDEYEIPTKPCQISFWNTKTKLWDGKEFKIPVINSTDSIVLVPRQYVRRQGDLMNHSKYCQKYVLTILQRELIDANDSLVRTLKTGKRRGEPIVTKKSIEDDPRFQSIRNKQYIGKFIMKHPDSVEKYRQELEEKHNPIDVASYSGREIEDDTIVRLLLEKLKELSPGKGGAGDYHKTVYELLQYIFDFSLRSFEKEYKMDGDRGRIDIIAVNYASGGFFKDVKDLLNAGSVPMECKNYSVELGNAEFNQLADRMGRKTSRFGILFCRESHNSNLKHQTDRWLRDEKLILVIDDEKLIELVEIRLSKKFEILEKLLSEMKVQVEYGNR